MTTCNDCGEMLRFSERMGITRHKCDPEIIAAQVAHKDQEIRKFQLARARERQARIERFNARRDVDEPSVSTGISDAIFTPTYSSSYSSSSSSCSDSSSYSSSDSSSSCDSGSSSSD